MHWETKQSPVSTNHKLPKLSVGMYSYKQVESKGKAVPIRKLTWQNKKDALYASKGQFQGQEDQVTIYQDVFIKHHLTALELSK